MLHAFIGGMRTLDNGLAERKEMMAGFGQRNLARCAM
jgi:hypothetical protein